MQAALAKTLFTVGGQAVTGGGILTGVSLISNIAAGRQQQAAFQQQAEGVKAQAHQEKLRAQEESNLRRERLLNALAAQNVRAGAAGVKGGTTEALKLESTEAYEREQFGADVTGQAKQSGYARQAEGLRQSGKQSFRKSLLQTGMQLAEIG